MADKTFGLPFEGVNYIERHCAYGVILNESNQVALALCNGDYFLPGGGIEGLESPEECVIRECIEELALDVKVTDFICSGESYLQSIKTNKHYHMIGQFYITRIIKELDQPSEEDHLLVWMNGDDAVKNLQLESQAWAVSKAFSIKKGVA